MANYFVTIFDIGILDNGDIQGLKRTIARSLPTDIYARVWVDSNSTDQKCVFDRVQIETSDRPLTHKEMLAALQYVSDQYSDPASVKIDVLINDFTNDDFHAINAGAVEEFLSAIAVQKMFNVTVN